jgi:uncharacterized coiled-coil protein SlyX
MHTELERLQDKHIEELAQVEDLVMKEMEVQITSFHATIAQKDSTIGELKLYLTEALGEIDVVENHLESVSAATSEQQEHGNGGLCA